MTRTTPICNATYLQPGEMLCLLLTSAAVQRFIKWQGMDSLCTSTPQAFCRRQTACLLTASRGSEGQKAGLED